MRTSLPSYQSLSESKDTLDWGGWGGWGGTRVDLAGESVNLLKRDIKMDLNNEHVQSQIVAAANM